MTSIGKNDWQSVQRLVYKARQGDFMKKLFVILAVSLFVSGAQAFAQAPAVNPLRQIMSGIGAKVQALGPAIRDPRQNEASLVVGREMYALVISALQEKPTLVQGLPASEQAAALDRYRRLIADLAITNLLLTDALEANDNSAAFAAFQRMNEIKREGHSLFIPPRP
jgi:hypothetical protein